MRTAAGLLSEYLTTISFRRYYTNLLVQVVFSFSAFVLKTRICPGLAQPVPESSRRPLVHCKAIGEALHFYNVPYQEGSSSEFPSVWLASVPVVPPVGTSLHQ